MNYKVKITRFDEYEVSVDTSIWDKEALTHWSKHMFEVESVEDLIEPFILDFQNYEIVKNGVFLRYRFVAGYL